MSQSKQESEGHVTRHHAYGYITSYISHIQDLPKPGHRWTTLNKPQGLRRQVKAMKENGIITQHRHTPTEDGDDPEWVRYEYETNPRAYRDIQHALQVLSFTPCGHTGVQNLGDGEYTCGYEYCDERFDREAAEKAVF